MASSKWETQPPVKAPLEETPIPAGEGLVPDNPVVETVADIVEAVVPTATPIVEIVQDVVEEGIKLVRMWKDFGDEGRIDSDVHPGEVHLRQSLGWILSEE